MLKKMDRLFFLDAFYLFLLVFLVFCIVEDKNTLDVMYFILLNFYYVKVKLCHFKKNHN